MPEDELDRLLAVLGLTEDQVAEALAVARKLLADPAARERLMKIVTQEQPGDV